MLALFRFTTAAAIATVLAGSVATVAAQNTTYRILYPNANTTWDACDQHNITWWVMRDAGRNLPRIRSNFHGAGTWMGCRRGSSCRRPSRRMTPMGRHMVSRSTFCDGECTRRVADSGNGIVARATFVGDLFNATKGRIEWDVPNVPNGTYNILREC